ncbi:MAG: type III pantothenate kinase [Gammaproteobacteria bacterium]|nr:type III pantothenate kinase [Gammaproteobacteria bacterium]NDE56645.1 type III pantothenate kinase [Gammaproteobacteria bacterium]NDG86463.1 type III pantothenate kinase [Gammaproteobacteria bacterium]
MKTLLLIDVGNSRIKWAVEDDQGLHLGKPFDLALESLHEALQAAWGDLTPPEAVALSNVAGAIVESLIIAWIRSTWQREVFIAKTLAEAEGIINGYREPQTLGVDRWLGLLGLQSVTSLPAMIVDCGTAITIDILDPLGRHQGGYIAPGLQTMAAALTANTHALKSLLLPAIVRSSPERETAGGIAAGCLLAAVGLIERVYHQESQRADGPFSMILIGGDADRIAPHLKAPFRIDQTLILRGLKEAWLRG